MLQNKQPINLKNNLVDTGITILPNGQIQVLFSNIEIEQLLMLPYDIYHIVKEFLRHDGEINFKSKDSLTSLINVAEELLPDVKRMEQAIKHLEVKTTS